MTQVLRGVSHLKRSLQKSSKSTLVIMPNCWRSHAAAHPETAMNEALHIYKDQRKSNSESNNVQ